MFYVNESVPTTQELTACQEAREEDGELHIQKVGVGWLVAPVQMREMTAALM